MTIAPKDAPKDAPSRHARAASRRRVLLILFCFFLVMGGIGFYVFTVRPLIKIWSARDWVETPCAVTSAGVQRSRSGKKTTYKAVICYSYQVNGTDYSSCQYDLMGFSISVT